MYTVHINRVIVIAAPDAIDGCVAAAVAVAVSVPLTEEKHIYT